LNADSPSCKETRINYKEKGEDYQAYGLSEKLRMSGEINELLSVSYETVHGQ